MKNKFFYWTAIFVITILAAVNVNVSLNNNDRPDINLNKVEAVAFEWDGFWDRVDAGLTNTFQGQGWTKDERESSRPCPSSTSSSGSGSASYGGGSVSGGGSSSASNPAGRDEIICPYGTENCTPIKC